ncbi:MAG: right-handed parallel beta-helix repeat-containing protein [Anaerolineales bacterium]|nr:right-handed parallel beta-helix repeat-containing protein [Anaerolineales bacterium]
MNKHKDANLEDGKAAINHPLKKRIIISAVLFAIISILLIASVSLADSFIFNLGINDSIDVFCEGRGIQIDPISETFVSITCFDGRIQATATPLPFTATPLPLTATSHSTIEPGQTPTATAAPQGQAIYVAPNGNDNWPGTIDQPLQTIQKAIDLVHAGNTIYLRGGQYVEKIHIQKSGTVDHPITIAAYPGENPVIDGQYNIPAGDPAACNGTVSPPKCYVYAPLVLIQGNYIVFSGIEVMHSRGRGITVAAENGVRPHHVTIEKCSVHDVRSAAIQIMDSDYITVNGCEAFHASDFATHARSGYDLNWPVAVNSIRASQVIFSNNVIYENYGEGIAAGRDSLNVRIENNVIYNNYALQVYIHRSQHVKVAQNLVYHTNDPAFHRGGNPSQCIVVNNELNFVDSLTVKNIEIVNNFVAGCRHNISIWGVNTSDVITENVLIAHNTLVNAKTNNDTSAVGLNINAGNLRNVRIMSNIIIQDEDEIVSSTTNPEVIFANNLWSRTPPGNVSSSSDIVGDARLVSGNISLIPGGVNAASFMIADDSPAINRAQSRLVDVDYFGNGRVTQPDIGAHENR